MLIWIGIGDWYNVYYCVELSLILLIFRLIMYNVFWNTQNAPDCTILIQIFRWSIPPEPLARIWIYIITGLSTRLGCNIWCIKGKDSISFYISLVSGGYCPPDPLVKYECIYCCANVRIWVDLGEKYGTKFGLLHYYPKNCWFLGW